MFIIYQLARLEHMGLIAMTHADTVLIKKIVTISTAPVLKVVTPVSLEINVK